jgi:stress-induced-phosphoprotein 1
MWSHNNALRITAFSLIQFKDKGNAALKAGKISEAIENYSKAINLDGANHVYFSNRSAAYLQKGDGHNALEDANACIGLAGDTFSKGYSRKGAALHALKRYNDALAAYDEGLIKFPGDPALTKGREEVVRDKDGPPRRSAGGGGEQDALFGPQMMAQMALDPKLRPYLNDPDVMAKIKHCQSNPNAIGTFLQDPKFMKLFEVMMGVKIGTAGDMDDDQDARTASRSASNSSSNPPPSQPEPMEEEPEEDWSELPPEERKIKEDKKAAVQKKEQANQLYKEKKFEQALAMYDEAIALDTTNMTFYNNKAAVYMAQKKYQECIDQCLQAVEIGKANRASFDDRAKALTRVAKAYQKLGDLAKAIEYCEMSQLESFDKDTQRLLKTMELEKKKHDKLAYQDDAKAEEAKQRGNDLFREQKYGEAVLQYEEAVKRAPKNAPIRNNLAAALCKVMDFAGAKREIEVAIDLDPKYVKAWARKGGTSLVCASVRIC